MTIVYKEYIPEMEKYFLLFKSTGWNEEYKLTKEELNNTLMKSYYCVSAYDGERLIGFGRIMSDGILHAMIYEMIVYQDYQGRGIGREILNRLLKKCFENNIRDIQLFCAIGKRHFYEKSGFATRPDEKPGMEYVKNQSL